MALDIIKDIVEAEARADEMIKNAEAQAASLKSEDKKKGEAIIAEAMQKSKADLNEISKTAIEESKAETDKIAKQAETDCGKVRQEASAKMDRAVEAVIGKVVGINGNS